MEEKLSVLEALGAVKELLAGSYWSLLNGTPEKSASDSFNSSTDSHINIKKQDCSNLQKNEKFLTLPKNTQENNLLKNHEITDYIYSLPTTSKTTDVKVVLKKSCSKMEITNSNSNILGGSNNTKDDKAFQELNSDDHFNENVIHDINMNNEKTDASENFRGSLIIMSEADNVNKMNSAECTFGILEEFDSSEGEDFNNEIIPVGSNIPSSIQEWINHLPSDNKIQRGCDDSGDAKGESEDVPAAKEDNSVVAAKLSRETSVQSSSSLDSILDSRRPDPVEIFLNLGFGGMPGVDMDNCRIPRRFLVPSKCKGGDWNEFLRRELLQAQNFECSSLGFRGLSGPSYRRPSAIVANIMEKLRERASPPTNPRSRFSMVARRVLNEKSVLNKLTHEFQSVLSPDSRKFLQNQGKISPEVPRRRIIFGQKSFAFAHDGEFVEVESSKAHSDNSAASSSTNDNPVVLTSKKSKSEAGEPSVFSNPEVLLKLRRSSLQKQKKIDEDSDVEDIFFVVGNNNQSAESNSLEKYSKKADKIPRRFLSSSNLKTLEKDNNMSETMRWEVEKEIRTLSQRIKSVSNQDLPSVLKQVKELCSKLENPSNTSSEA